MHHHNFEIQNVLVSKRRMLLSWKVVNRYKFGTIIMPDEDKTFSGSLALDLEFDDVMCTHSIIYYVQYCRHFLCVQDFKWSLQLRSYIHCYTLLYLSVYQGWSEAPWE